MVNSFILFPVCLKRHVLIAATIFSLFVSSSAISYSECAEYNIASPGTVHVRPADSVTEKELEALLGRFGFSAINGSLHGSGVSYWIDVEVTHEEAWIAIFRKLSAISVACRQSLLLASVDADALIGKAMYENSRPRAPTGSANLHIEQLDLDFLLGYFAKIFEQKSADVNILKRDQNRAQLSIKSLRGEVIITEKYWEHLKLNLIYVPQPEAMMVYLIVDGYYATGAGDRIPTDSAYQSMEREYYQPLLRYTQNFITNLQEIAKKGGTSDTN